MNNNILNVTDELHLYLVAEGLKPATLITITNSKFSELRHTLDNLGLLYSYTPIDGKRYNNCEDGFSFKISKTKHNLKKFLKAKSAKEIGLALGYPHQAVNSFAKVIEDIVRDGQYFQVCLARAKYYGVEIPMWIAYLDHVPKSLDIFIGDVSRSSRKLGEKYQRFVREHNPSLADRVERDFLNLVDNQLPIGWVKRPDFSYTLCFKPKGVNIKS